MSLIERVERARRLNAAAEAGSTDGTTAVAEAPPSTTDVAADSPAAGPLASRAAAASAAAEAAAVAALAAEEAPVAPAAPPRRPATPIPVAPEPASLDAEPIISMRASAPVTTAAREQLLYEIHASLQAEVITTIDTLFDLGPNEVRVRIEAIVEDVVAREAYAVTGDERKWLVQQMVDEIVGLGPLEPLLSDESITEVMVNGPRHVYIERRGKIQRVDVHFLGDEHVRRIIDRIITPIGRRIDESSPRVDARLPDGSRVNAVIAPLSLIGPVITVRKFAARPFTVEDLIGFGTASAEMFEFLRVCIEARLNVFVSGGTGSGKTTTLNVLSSFIPSDERIITIEDAAELQLRQPHIVTLEARPPNLEGTGEITIRDLLKNALHMRPDRVIVGECRSGEALDMLQAMTTGQDGSLSTGHANSPPDMLRRLETMVLMTGYEMPLRAIREQIASAVDLIVHTARLKDGTRKVINITEIYGIEDDAILTQDIFTFEQTGVVDGKVQGDLVPTGIRPRFMGRFATSGIELPPDEFGIPPEDPANPTRPHPSKNRFGSDELPLIDATNPALGPGKAVVAGGMVYISSVGPVDRTTGQLVRGGIRDQTRQCLENLTAALDAAGSSLDKVVWANWCLREATEFEPFSEAWNEWFPNGAPVGQGTLMAPAQRRAGFRVSLGVIAQADDGAPTPITVGAKGGWETETELD